MSSYMGDEFLGRRHRRRKVTSGAAQVVPPSISPAASPSVAAAPSEAGPSEAAAALMTMDTPSDAADLPASPEPDTSSESDMSGEMFGAKHTKGKMTGSTTPVSISSARRTPSPPVDGKLTIPALLLGAGAIAAAVYFFIIKKR